MKFVTRSLHSSVKAGLRPELDVISTLARGSRLPLLATLYVFGLFVVVTIAVCLPLSTYPLLLLLVWLVPFFLFALTVIVCSYIHLVLVYYRMAVGLYRWTCRRVVRAKPSAPVPSARSAGVWDRWLDEAGG